MSKNVATYVHVHAKSELSKARACVFVVVVCCCLLPVSTRTYVPSLE